MLTKNEKQTTAYGQKLATTLIGGEVLLLIGDLGAGKTTLTKGIAAGLGVTQLITSPTFVLMKVYSIERSKIKDQRSGKITTFVHIDTYRGLSIEDLKSIGATEYFGRADSVCVVEWGEGLEQYLDNERIVYKKIYIKNIFETTRKIIIK